MTDEAVRDLRRRVLALEAVTQEELRDAISSLRQERMNAAPKKKGKEAGPTLTSKDLASLLDFNA